MDDAHMWLVPDNDPDLVHVDTLACPWCGANYALAGSRFYIAVPYSDGKSCHTCESCEKDFDVEHECGPEGECVEWFERVSHD